MKLTFEIHGYEITIEETEEGVEVIASKDGESVEEFTLELGEEMPEGEDDDIDPQAQAQVQPAQGQAQGQGQNLPSEDFEVPGGDDENKLESFISFIKKRNN